MLWLVPSPSMAAEEALRGERPGNRVGFRGAGAGHAAQLVDPVVVQRAAHRDRQLVLRLGRARCRDRVDPDEPHEERTDRRREGDVQLPVVRRVRLRADPGQRRRRGRARHAGVGQRVAVLAGRLDGEGLRSRDVARQADDPGQGRGVRRSLDAQGVGPVPGHVDHDRTEAEERDEPPGEDHEHLAS